MRDREESAARPAAEEPRWPRVARLFEVGTALATALVMVALRGPKVPPTASD